MAIAADGRRRIRQSKVDALRIASSKATVSMPLQHFVQERSIRRSPLSSMGKLRLSLFRSSLIHAMAQVLEGGAQGKRVRCLIPKRFLRLPEDLRPMTAEASIKLENTHTALVKASNESYLSPRVTSIRKETQPTSQNVGNICSDIATPTKSKTDCPSLEMECLVTATSTVAIISPSSPRAPVVKRLAILNLPFP